MYSYSISHKSAKDLTSIQYADKHENFNNGYLNVKEQKEVTYQIKDDKLYVDIKFGEQKIRIIYKVEK